MKKDRPGVIAPPPLIYLAVFALGYYLQSINNLALPENLYSIIGGWALVALAIIITASAIITMKRAKTHIDVYKPTIAIVSNGPFRFSRNPIYLSLTMLYLGGAFVNALIWPLIVLPIALLVMQFGVIKREERYLTAKFAETYLNYQAKVRRWL